ncbi:MAG: hypothetical protein AAFZ74_16870 [Pseudomonadota bacterium]
MRLTLGHATPAHMLRVMVLLCAVFAWAPLLVPVVAQSSERYTRAKLHQDLFESYEYLTSDEVDIYVIDKTAQFAGLMGREDLLSEVYAFWLGDTCTDISVAPPLETLLEAATDTQIVILNEAHMMPLHRADPIGFIEALVENGFTHYAYESFSDSIMTREGEVLTEDVYYSNDPVHGRLLSVLKDAGVKLVAYEGSGPDGREAAQAQALVERVFGEDPDARLIVVAGWAHVYEHIDGFAGQMMARRLKDLSGIDPLTIQQTGCSLSTDASAALVGGYESNRGMSNDGATDIYLAHPALSFTHQRPDWRRTVGDVDVPIPKDLRLETEAVLIEARRPGAPPEAIAIDRVMRAPGETLPLLLPPGTYEVFGWTKSGPVQTDPILITVP